VREAEAHQPGMNGGDKIIQAPASGNEANRAILPVWRGLPSR
jgi:hypothetical protein